MKKEKRTRKMALQCPITTAERTSAPAKDFQNKGVCEYNMEIELEEEKSLADYAQEQVFFK